MTQPYIMYTAALGLSIVWVSYLLVSRALLLSSRRRLKRIENEDVFETFPSSTPLDDPHKVEVKQAQESIRAHFRNTKRLLLPGFLFLALVAASMPFLSAVPTTLVSVLLGAATVTAGVAAKPVVENFIAGLVMGFSKVLNIGDTVLVNDHYATVEDISLTHTTLKIWDWRRHIIPNSKMIQLDFLNYSVVDSFQWAYVEFWVSYSADLDALAEYGMSAARQSDYFAQHEEPSLFIMETGKDSVKVWLAAWADSPSNGWMLKSDIRMGLIRGMKELNIAPHEYHIKSDQVGTFAQKN